MASAPDTGHPRREDGGPAQGTRSRCRLLYVVPQLAVGGLERQLYYLLSAMDLSTFAPQVAVWNYAEADRYVRLIKGLGVPVLPVTGANRWEKLKALGAYIREVNPEIVHSYSFYTNVLVAIASSRIDPIPIGSIRCDFDYERSHSPRLIGATSARWPRFQICNSWRAAENVARRGGLLVPRTTTVVSNGVDLSMFSTDPPPRRPFPVLAGAGTLSERKNWAVLFPVVADLAADGLPTTLRIAGEGPLRASLQADIERQGLRDVVELTGRVEDMPSFLAAADIVVHTATNEGTPNVVLEAMAAARPVVALDSGDVGRLIDDGTTGFVIPADRLDLLTDRLRTLVNDDGLRLRMGENGRRKAAESFGCSALVEKTLAAYQKAGWRGADRVQEGD